MKDVTNRISAVEVAVTPESTRMISELPRKFVAWAIRRNAERWGQRALFYERHRDYFPRLSSGPFVARCRELEATYQGSLTGDREYDAPSRVGACPFTARRIR